MKNIFFTIQEIPIFEVETDTNLQYQTIQTTKTCWRDLFQLSTENLWRKLI